MTSRLLPWFDGAIRLVPVTPDMHGMHHSTKRVEHDRNHGFSRALWDRFFKTDTAAPAGDHAGPSVGPHRQDQRPANRVTFEPAVTT